jgi:PAS domain S-box-containing protein
MEGKIETAKYYENVVATKSGQERLIAWHNILVRDKDKKIIGVLSSGEDITERKQAEEWVKKSREDLRQIIDLVPHMIFVRDEDGRFILANKTVADSMGIPVEDLTGKLQSDINVNIDEVSEILKEDKKVIDQQESIEIPQEVYIDKFGSIRYLHTYKVPFKTTPEEKKAILVVSIDVTQRKLATDEIKKYQAHLEEKISERTSELKNINEELLNKRMALEKTNTELRKEVIERKKAEESTSRFARRIESTNKELEAFSSAIAHDLRTPLRSIEGFSEILVEEYLSNIDEEGRRLINIIMQNTKFMGTLIEDILSFVSLSRQDVVYSDIDMENILKEVIVMLKKMNPGRRLRFEIKNILPVRGDKSMIRQVFLSLVGNAIKFTKMRDVGIVEMGSRSEDGNNIYYVKDNGIGFDMKYSENIFEMFKRLHLKEEYEGTGVGLSFVRRAINKHGGRVWAEGQANRGATFYFSLPKKEDRK